MNKQASAAQSQPRARRSLGQRRDGSPSFEIKVAYHEDHSRSAAKF